jgi:hypothetical protein
VISAINIEVSKKEINMTNANVNITTEVADALHDVFTKINAYNMTLGPHALTELVPDELKRRLGVQNLETSVRDIFEFEHTGIPRERLMLLSNKLTTAFHDFNRRYFDDKLPAYKVQVGYVIYSLRSLIGREQREIDMPAAPEALMVAALLGNMAAIATDSTCIHDMSANRIEAWAPEAKCYECWNEEMNRLDRAGAPLYVSEETRDLTVEQFIAASTLPFREYDCKTITFFKGWA